MIRIATTTSRIANNTFDAVSVSKADTNPPAIAETIPEHPIIAAADRSTFFVDRFLIVPMIAVGTMTAIEVPLAITEEIPNSTTIAGTNTIPPPTPNNPASAPAAKPIAMRARTIDKFN